ncbi:MAG: SufS family cysteine desulfurase [bacterium]|jgi:cysteine desulfurase/selenocysteine lyase
MSSTSVLVAPSKNREIYMPYDVYRVREDFPILKQIVHGKPLIYLDNAASTQKPQVVIDAISDTYQKYYANIHRGVHWLSQKSTELYEQTREKVRAFIGAADTRECIFVRNATEGINLVAHSYGKKFVQPGDEIIISAMEHHSNIVPWQILCEDRGAKLRVIPINDDGELLMEEYEKMLNPKTRMVAVVHLSNALGTINPIKQIIDLAHAQGTPVLIDGAQSTPHIRVNVHDLDCDFFVFSGHKVYGPSGIGVLYGKAEWLEQMPPYMGGGDMIRSVSFEKTVYNILPYKFEAGTPNITDTIGLGAAIDYVSEIGLDNIFQYEHHLLEYAQRELADVPEVRIIGTAQEKSGVISMVFRDVHPHDVGTFLDRKGIAVRVGHHCAEPVMKRFNLAATARASLGLYNTREEIDALVDGIKTTLEVFR